MRVCVLTTSFPRSADDDAGIFVQRLVLALAQQGLSGQVIVPRDRQEPLQEQLSTFTIQRFCYGLLRPGSLAFGMGIMPNIRKNPLVLGQAPTLLVQMLRHAARHGKSCDLFHANWLASGLAAYLAQPYCARPYILTLRGEDVKLLERSLLRRLLAPVISKAAFVTSVNQRFVETLGQYFPAQSHKLLCIPNGVSDKATSAAAVQDFQRKYGISNSTKLLLYTGRVIPLKRIELLIQAMSQPALAGFQLLLCGRNDDMRYDTQLRRLAQQLGVQDHVRLLGRIPPREAALALAACSYYLSASEYEGRSNSVLEALAAGKVVLVSDIPGHREIVQHDSTGFLLDPTQPDQLAALIQHLEQQPAEKARIEQAARASVQKLSWESCAKAYSRLFAQALGSGSL